MNCTWCAEPGARVLSTRGIDSGFELLRKRVCPVCGYRFVTIERFERAVEDSGTRTRFQPQPPEWAMDEGESQSHDEHADTKS